MKRLMSMAAIALFVVAITGCNCMKCDKGDAKACPPGCDKPCCAEKAM